MSLPRYKVIQNYILEGISSGLFGGGGQIPTEEALAKQFNVSRMTVNKAITELSQQKIVERTARRGTFVVQKVESPPMQVVDIAEEILGRGHEHKATIFQKKAVKADKSTSLLLDIEVGDQAYFCHILHHENDVPMLLEKRYINSLLVPDFIEQDFNQTTPSGFLLKNYALKEMEHTIEAIAASKFIAESLQLFVGSPCLCIVRRTWSDKGLISAAEFIASGSRYKLHSRIPV